MLIDATRDELKAAVKLVQNTIKTKRIMLLAEDDPRLIVVRTDELERLEAKRTELEARLEAKLTELEARLEAQT